MTLLFVYDCDREREYLYVEAHAWVHYTPDLTPQEGHASLDILGDYDDDADGAMKRIGI